MRRFLSILAVLAVMVALASSASCTPVTVEPGVAVDATGTPIEVQPLDVISRTIVITNSNADKSKGYDVGITWVVQPTPIHAALTVTGTVSGLRKARQIQLAVPVDFEFVAGSLTINGMPATPPSPSGGYYAVTLDLPKTSTTTIRDQIRFTPPL
jgi:hypothetical protein